MGELDLLILFVKAVDYQLHNEQRVGYSKKEGKWYFDEKETTLEDLFDLLIERMYC